MGLEFEIAKKRKLVPKEDIEAIIKKYLNSAAFHSNSLINVPSEKFSELNEFEDSIYSIAINEIPVSFY